MSYFYRFYLPKKKPANKSCIKTKRLGLSVLPFLQRVLSKALKNEPTAYKHG